MITVAILINGQPIFTRTAVNKGNKQNDGNVRYETDCGNIVWHKREEGAVALAKKLLDLIEEPE